MAKQLKLRRGTTSQHSSFTGAEGEVTVDTDKESLVVHNGSTAGGFAIARADSPDSQKTRWGNSNDLQIWHDGNSYVHHENTSGNLYLQGDSIQLRTRSDSNEKYITASHNGAAALYYDGTERLSTISTGAYVDGFLGIGTSSPATAGQALTVHSTAHEVVRFYGDTGASNGYIRIQIDEVNDDLVAASGTRVFIGDNAADIVIGTANGSYSPTNSFISLEHGGNIRMAAGATPGLATEGLTITPAGNLQIANDSGKLQLGTSQDLQLYHDGTDSILKNSTGTLSIRGAIVSGENAAGTENTFYAVENGAFSAYYDHSKKLETTSTGTTISGTNPFLEISGSAASSGDTGIFINANANHWILKADNYTSGNQFQIRHGDTSSSETAIGCVQNGAVGLYYNNVKTVETYDASDYSGITVLGDEDGHAVINMHADEGDDAADKWQWTAQTNGSSYIKNFSNGSTYEYNIKMTGAGATELFYDGVKHFETNANGFKANDDLKLQLGNGNDFTMMFNGSNTIVDAVSGNLNIREGGYERIELQADGDLFIRTSLRAWEDDSFDVGRPGHRWDDIYATNTSITTSDRNEKNTIVDSDLGLSFVNKLKPVSYKLNGKTRTHYGLIAQDIETTLSDISKPTADFAGFIKTTITKDDYTKETLDTPKIEYGLRYSEFISPLIKAVQELSAEVETLKTKVAALEAG